MQQAVLLQSGTDGNDLGQFYGMGLSFQEPEAQNLGFGSSFGSHTTSDCQAVANALLEDAPLDAAVPSRHVMYPRTYNIRGNDFDGYSRTGDDESATGRDLGDNIEEMTRLPSNIPPPDKDFIDDFVRAISEGMDDLRIGSSASESYPCSVYYSRSLDSLDDDGEDERTLPAGILDSLGMPVHPRMPGVGDGSFLANGIFSEAPTRVPSIGKTLPPPPHAQVPGGPLGQGYPMNSDSYNGSHCMPRMGNASHIYPNSYVPPPLDTDHSGSDSSHSACYESSASGSGRGQRERDPQPPPPLRRRRSQTVMPALPLESVCDEEELAILAQINGDESEEAKQERRKLQNRLAQRRRRKRNSMSDLYTNQYAQKGEWPEELDPSLARRRRKSSDFSSEEERLEWRRAQNREAKRRYRERFKSEGAIPCDISQRLNFLNEMKLFKERQINSRDGMLCSSGSFDSNCQSFDSVS